MNRQRLSLSVLLLISLLASSAGPSIARYPRLQARQIPTILQSGQLGTTLKDMLASYQRKNMAITLDQDKLEDPHQLIVTSLGAKQLNGEIAINGEVVRLLKPGINQVNLSPYLQEGNISVDIEGQYGPSVAEVFVMFEGGETSLNQTVSGARPLDYHLDIKVQ